LVTTFVKPQLDREIDELMFCTGVSAEEVGQQAANELVHNLEHGGCVDDYLQDQVIHLSFFFVKEFL
jgi:RNA 3'-terminal phosphate cyclase